ncbi:MAG: hypothetical protein AABW64_00890 [Nanoarchaeota archaeon]
MIFHKKLEIAYASSYTEAMRYRDGGFEPVECSFGDISVTRKYPLDHHGLNSEYKPVSLTACEIATSSGFEPLQRFVVTGKPDADCIYSILLLSATISPCESLARAIAELDSDPVGIDQRVDHYLQAGPAFRMYNHFAADVRSYHRALDIGQKVFSHKGLSGRLTKKAIAYETNRRNTAQKEFFSREHRVALVQSDTDSMDIWLTRYGCEGEPLDFVLQHKGALNILTIAGKTPEAVERLGNRSKPATAYFSERGLLDYCATLDRLLGYSPSFAEHARSGGRPNIIGSPRGHKVSMEIVRKKIYPNLCSLISSHNNPPLPNRAA